MFIRQGNRDYLARDGIAYAGRNVEVWVNGERIVMGVHEGRVNHVRVFFLHNESVFPRPYPALDAAAQVWYLLPLPLCPSSPHTTVPDAAAQMRVLAAFGQGCLELLVQWGISPSVVVTNDWFTALVPAYARHGRLAGAFNSTDFMHICHNLDPVRGGGPGLCQPPPDQPTAAPLLSTTDSASAGLRGAAVSNPRAGLAAIHAQPAAQPPR